MELVILPKLPLPPSALLSVTVWPGMLKIGVLNRLKASLRNWNFQRSVMLKSLNIEKSSVLVGGPVMRLETQVAARQRRGDLVGAMSNHWFGVRPPAGAWSAVKPETMSGSQRPHTPWQLPFKPYATPVRSVTSAFACQLPISDIGCAIHVGCPAPFPCRTAGPS